MSSATISYINAFIEAEIKANKLDTNCISDSYHTFGELYDFRCALTNALFKRIWTAAWRYWKPEEGDNSSFETSGNPIWKSKLHSDGTMFEDFFIVGYACTPGKQITFHFPLAAWDIFDYAKVLDKAPEWDGHTSADALERLKSL